MDLAILEAIKYIKQIVKKKVSLKNILQRFNKTNKTNATNIDMATLKIEFSSKHWQLTEFAKRGRFHHPSLCVLELSFLVPFIIQLSENRFKKFVDGNI